MRILPVRTRVFSDCCGVVTVRVVVVEAVCEWREKEREREKASERESESVRERAREKERE